MYRNVKIEEIFWETIRTTEQFNECITSGVFSAFFGRVKISILRGIREEMRTDVSQALESVLVTCMEEAQKIMLRTLIYEMHISEKSGELLGENDQDKFVYYSNFLLCQENYLRELFAEYPLLYKALMQMMENSIRNICDLMKCFYADMALLNQYFFLNNPCSNVVCIESGASDSHRGGCKVYFLKLDNGEQIVYKPRGLAIDLAYENLISWVYEGIGIKHWWPKAIDQKTYGWSQWVAFESCSTYDALCEYYRRNGVLLCISYLLGTEDLHYENLIAHGEYPVIIDLEMAVGTKGLKAKNQSASEIEKVYLDSVLHTGLLPMFAWNENGEGINVSAMNGKGGQLSPIRIPVIVDAGTLNMLLSSKLNDAPFGRLFRADFRTLQMCQSL